MCFIHSIIVYILHTKWASYVTYLPYSFSFNSSSLCFIVCHQCFICDTIARTQTENACSQCYKTSFSLHSSTMNKKHLQSIRAIHDNIQQFTFVLAVGTFPLATRKIFSDERSRVEQREREQSGKRKEKNKQNE